MNGCVALNKDGLMGPDAFEMKWPLPNVWLGVSVENQKTADERIPLLLNTPAAVRWISAKPLLGPVDLLHVQWPGQHKVDVLRRGTWEFPKWFHPGFVNHSDMNGIDWVVVGGESSQGTIGHKNAARPMHPDWARSLRDQCQTAGVPFFFKQWGNWVPHELPPTVGVNNGAHAYLRDDGSFGIQGDYWDGKAVGMNHVGKKASGRLLDGRE